jgi:predicted dehydrogenase
MAKPMNFAVVGLGMGGHHCLALRSAKNANLVAVCDIDGARLKEHTKQFKVAGTKKYDDLLKDPDIDGICIATESGTHADFGIKAARAGKHIVMEKPVDITPARIKKFEDVLKKTKVKCGCIFQYRTEPINIHVKKSIEKGKMGKVIGAHAHLPWFRADSYYAGRHGKWKGTWKLDGGGSLMNQGIHTVDLIQWLVGPVDSVAGFYGVHNHKIEAEDQTVAILKFRNGATGTLITSTCCIPGKDQRIYVYGSKGSYCRVGGTLESYDMGGPKERERMMNLFGPGKKKKTTGSVDPMAVSADGHTIIIEDLVRAVRANRDPLITVKSAKHSVEVATAIFKAARTGRVVKVDSVKK